MEQVLIDSLEKFLLELGRGFTFYACQKRVTDDGDHYYIDLVFYNYVLNCFVLIDLKTRCITQQDIGQMDFYTRLFDGEYKASSMNPTVGIVLGTEKTRAVAKYTAVADGDRLYAAQYMTELPTEEELAVVLERNRRELEAAQTARALEGACGRQGVEERVAPAGPSSAHPAEKPRTPRGLLRHGLFLRLCSRIDGVPLDGLDNGYKISLLLRVEHADE